MENGSFRRTSLCHVLTGLGTYVLGFISMLCMGVREDKWISLAIGLGFGQISLIAIWCVVGKSRVRFSSSAVALLGCYLAMALSTVVHGQHIDGTFYPGLAISCIVYFLAMAGGMLLVRKLRGVTMVGLEDTQVPNDFSSQYGIRDIMIIMSVVALATVAIKFVGTQEYAPDLATMLLVFALISLSFFLMGWPVVVACLSERWGMLAALAVFIVLAITLVQAPVFTSILGPGTDESFVFLDAPFVFAVVVHSLISRAFGYRLKVVDKLSELAAQPPDLIEN